MQILVGGMIETESSPCLNSLLIDLMACRLLLFLEVTLAVRGSSPPGLGEVVSLRPGGAERSVVLLNARPEVTKSESPNCTGALLWAWIASRGMMGLKLVDKSGASTITLMESSRTASFFWQCSKALTWLSPAEGN